MKATPYHLCFETLGNKLRVEIIMALKEKPMTVLGLAKELGAEQSTVSHSLKVLKQCRFVKSEIQGRERLYSLGKSFLAEMPQGKNIFEVVEAHSEKNCRKCGRLCR